MKPNEIYNIGDYVGLGIRELKSDELNKYCPSSKPSKPPYYPSTKANTSFIHFTSSFHFVLYTSGCYYIEKSTGKWSSIGTEVIDDTSILFTHCKSSHLTTFAAGLDILPSKINISYNLFNQNKTIYLTVIILLSLYILFIIWGRFMDRRDCLKIGVTPLVDNKINDNYYYEIIVLTGNRMHAGTDSKVRSICVTHLHSCATLLFYFSVLRFVLSFILMSAKLILEF